MALALHGFTTLLLHTVASSEQQEGFLKSVTAPEMPC